MSAAITNSRGGFALFETAIGGCALVWRDGSIVGAALPEASPERLRARLASRFPDAVETVPPPPVAKAIERIVGLLAGGRTDLSDIEIDLDGVSDFDRRVYQAARRIPCGEVRTYGEVARGLGEPKAAQAVGVALARNPVPIIVPCHRVLAGGGRSGGFSAPGGVATKFRILEIEGARRPGETGLFADLPLAVKPSGSA
jgi:methylated-DNA-[protein]-cysteine S-methyltransferase